MEIQGKLMMLLPLQSGTSAKGDWKKQDAIFETLEQFPKKVNITFWSEKVDEINKYNQGSILKVSVNIESREYNGKWYTDVRAWKLEAGDSSNSTSSTANNSATIDRQHADEPVDLSHSDGAVDDLPF